MDYTSGNYYGSKASSGEGGKTQETRRGGDYPPPGRSRGEDASFPLRFESGNVDAENHSSGSPSQLLHTDNSLSYTAYSRASASVPARDFMKKYPELLAKPRKKRRNGVFFTVAAMLLLSLVIICGLIWIIAFAGTGAVPETEVPDKIILPTPTAKVEPKNPEPTPVYNAPPGKSASMVITGQPDASSSMGFADIYEKCIPSVVSIIAESPTSVSMGTGIIMTGDGYIITNDHIISGGERITVTLQDNEVYIAALVGDDSISDLAVLKIEKTGLTPAEFGDSDSLRVGDIVVAIGNPTTSEQLRGTMTDGIVSAINRTIEVDGRMMTLLQTNAALNSGNSGGPLINQYGQVIGINIMKYVSETASIEGLGFAIPISVAKPIIDELIDKGYISGRVSIGILAYDIPAYAAEYYGLPEGIYIEEIDPRSDAYNSGLQTGDVIVAVNGEKVTNKSELLAYKNALKIGDTITLTVFRDGDYYDYDVVLVDEATLSD